MFTMSLLNSMHVLLVGTAVVCQYIHSFYFLGVCYKAVVLSPPSRAPPGNAHPQNSCGKHPVQDWNIANACYDLDHKTTLHGNGIFTVDIVKARHLRVYNEHPIIARRKWLSRTLSITCGN